MSQPSLIWLAHDHRLKIARNASQLEASPLGLYLSSWSKIVLAFMDKWVLLWGQKKSDHMSAHFMSTPASDRAITWNFTSSAMLWLRNCSAEHSVNVPAVPTYTNHDYPWHGCLNHMQFNMFAVISWKPVWKKMQLLIFALCIHELSIF